MYTLAYLSNVFRSIRLWRFLNEIMPTKVSSDQEFALLIKDHDEGTNPQAGPK